MAYVKNINGYDIKDQEARDSIDVLERYVSQPTSVNVPRVLVGLDLLDLKTSGVARVGDRIFLVGGYDNAENMGKLIEYSVSGNYRVKISDVQTGHANSLAYNPNTNMLYCAACKEYENGVLNDQNCYILYEYTLDGTLNRRIDMSAYVPDAFKGRSSLHGVAFDHKRGKMYTCVTTGLKTALFETTGDVNSMTFVEEIDMSCVMSNSIAQGLAVNDGLVYYPTISGMVAVYDLEAHEMKNVIFLDSKETSNTYFLGELEDIEFDETGAMYHTSFVGGNGPGGDTPFCIPFVTCTPVDGKGINNSYYENRGMYEYKFNRDTRGKFLPAEHWDLPFLECAIALLHPKPRVLITSIEYTMQYKVWFENDISLIYGSGCQINTRQLGFKGRGSIVVTDSGILNFDLAGWYIIRVNEGGQFSITVLNGGVLWHLPETYFIHTEYGSLITLGGINATNGATQYSINQWPKPAHSINIGTWTAQNRSDI